MTRRQQKARSDRRRRASARARALKVGGSALAVTLVPAAAAQAQTYSVTSLNDSGAGTLRDAIDQANAPHPSSGVDLITFQTGLSGAIDLATPLPTITDANGLDITGPDARALSLNASGIPTSAGQSVITDEAPSSAPLTISGLAMDDANAGAYAGGFISAGYAPVTLNADSFVNDVASSGGAVLAQGDLTISGSTFSGDKATAGVGGAIDIYGGGTDKISNSTIDGNAANRLGGGVAQYGGQLTVTGSTITGNTVSYTGSGTYPAGYGGGVATSYSRSLSLQDSIVADNSASGNPNLSSPAQHRDVYLGNGSSFSAQFSLIQNDTSGLPLDSTDITGQDPALGPLQNNGGPTDTRMPSASSPVIDQGAAFGLTTDQRGAPRPVSYFDKTNPPGGDGSDIGAVELQPTPVVAGLGSHSGVSGTQVTIFGEHFGNATAVMFGAATAPFKVNGDGSLTATVPAGTGTVDVTVTGPGGRSATGSADRFTFAAPSLNKFGRASARWHHSAVVVKTGITVECPAGGDTCQTRLSAETVVRSRLAVVSRRHRTRTLAIGPVLATTQAGHNQELTFILRGKTLRALKKLHKLRITLAVTGVDAADTISADKTITVRLPKKSHQHH